MIGGIIKRRVARNHGLRFTNVAGPDANALYCDHGSGWPARGGVEVVGQQTGDNPDAVRVRIARLNLLSRHDGVVTMKVGGDGDPSTKEARLSEAYRIRDALAAAAENERLLRARTYVLTALSAAALVAGGLVGWRIAEDAAPMMPVAPVDAPPPATSNSLSLTAYNAPTS